MLALDSDATRGWLDGIAYGPGVHVSQLQLLARLPHGYELRQYPDLSHSLAAMYPQPNWHRAWALTHGRLVVNPSPRRHSAIARMNMNSSYSRAIGFGGYSEGVSLATVGPAISRGSLTRPLLTTGVGRRQQV